MYYRQPRGPTEAELRTIVTEYVDLLTGKQTIYQMIQLAEEVEKRGGEPQDPVEYKWLYLERLWTKIAGRVEGLKAGGDDYLVKPYAFTELQARLQALVRRVQPDQVQTHLQLRDLELDTNRRRVTRGGKTINLKPGMSLREMYMWPLSDGWCSGLAHIGVGSRIRHRAPSQVKLPWK